jgi:hypothetical protein
MGTEDPPSEDRTKTEVKRSRWEENHSKKVATWFPASICRPLIRIASGRRDSSILQPASWPPSENPQLPVRTLLNMGPATITLIAAADATTPDATTTAIPESTLLWAALLLILVVALAGVLLLWYRRGFAFRRPEGKDAASSGEGEVFVRSLLALWLTLGLLVFTLLAFAIDDTSLRSTMVGALTASAGAAVAYYFSSKASDDARKDILGAIPGLNGTVKVPEFREDTLGKAQKWFGAHQDLISKSEPDSAKPEDMVTDQSPLPDTRVARGTTVKLIVTPVVTPDAGGS